MIDPLRQAIVQAADTLVVKVGTRVLTLPDGTLNHPRIDALAEELHTLAGSKHEPPAAKGPAADAASQPAATQPLGADAGPSTVASPSSPRASRRVVLVSSGAVAAGISKLG
jgi:hypothetical protein